MTWYLALYDSTERNRSTRVRVSTKVAEDDDLQDEVTRLLDYLLENEDSYLVIRKHRPVPFEEVS